MKKIWSRTLRPGEKWSGNIGRGKYIHFKALGDDANVSMLMYNMLEEKAGVDPSCRCSRHHI